MKTFTKYFLALSIISLLVTGLIYSIKREAQIKDFINDISSTNKEVVAINGENPTVESVQKGQQLWEARKPELAQKYKRLTNGEVLSDDSDLGKRIKESRDNSQTVLADSFAKYLKDSYAIQKQINDLNGRLIAENDKQNPSRKEIEALVNEIESKSNILEQRISVIKELDKLAESFKSIF
jgi:predicted  nucleic acid-binding Zn-ribbon protein